MPDFDRPISQFIADLDQRFPHTPFLALGQTALWDEPVKAVLLHEARAANPKAVWFAGVHDTDYFAKSIAHLATDEMFVAVGHDDGATKDLWSAAGEISALFGSESVPTRHMYRAHGVPFDWLRDNAPEGKKAFIAKHTLAWGWLGLVQTQAYNLISHDVSLRDIRKPLLDQLDWALKLSEDIVGTETETRGESPQALRQWISEYLENCSSACRLPDLYEALLPRLYALLSSDQTIPVTTKTSQLLKFNTTTCSLPRFDLVGHFLNRKTREAASASYNQAVSGSAIYQLNHFGEGAIPFDLVIPGRGRGTVRILATEVVVDTDPEPIRILVDKPVNSNADLAIALEAALGPDVVLVGKAITLVDMIAAEHLVVFHETASGYTPTTRAFNDRLRVCGISLNIHPLVRLKYSTWDALQSVDPSIELTLPSYLAASFGRSRIGAAEFGQTWSAVVRGQEAVLGELAQVRSPKVLMEYLARDESGTWSHLLSAYGDALGQLRTFQDSRVSLLSTELELKAKSHSLTAERLRLEHEMGIHWRSTVHPLLKALDTADDGEKRAMELPYLSAIEARNELYIEPLQRIRREAAEAKRAVLALRQQRRALERSVAILEARSSLAEIVAQAELARMEIVKTAFLTVDSLNHTNYRPTAWWFPLVDPAGDWIKAVRETAVARWEDLVTPLG